MSSFIPDFVCEFLYDDKCTYIGFSKHYPYRVKNIKKTSKERPISIKHAKSGIKRLNKQIKILEEYIKRHENH